MADTKLLFICTGNIDRSPTAEGLFRTVKGFQARSAGTMASARRRLTREDIEWADRAFAMEEHHASRARELAPGCSESVSVLGIPDVYRRGDPELISILERRLAEHGITI